MPTPTATDSQAPAAAPVSLLLLGAAAFVVTADIRVVNPLLRVIATEFGADVGDTGWIVTAYTVPYGLFQLLYGPLGDRLGKLRVMTVTLALFAVGTAACGLAPGLATLALLRFLTGAAAAALIPLSLSTIGDSFPYRERQAAIGRFLGALALGQILGLSLGGAVGDFVSWRAIFVGLGVAAGGMTALLWRAARRQPGSPRREGSALPAALDAYRRVLASPAARLVMLAVGLEGVFFFGAFAYLGAYLRDTFGLRYLVIGLLLSGFGLGSLVYSRAAGWLVGRLGERRMLALGGLVDGLGYLAFALLPVWQPLALVTIVLGLGYYLLHGTLQTRATELAPSARGTAVALFAFSLFLGQGIGAAALGVVVDGPGYAPAFALAALALMALGGGFVLAERRLAERAA